MTKVDAIEQVMIDNGGSASLQFIYDNIEKYYPSAKVSKDWAAGIRGVLYRELNRGQRFKKIGLSIYAVLDYQVEAKPACGDKVRMHSFIEGICLELGNFNEYLTYTADPSAIYRDNLRLSDIASLKSLPEFSYKEIVHEVRNPQYLYHKSSVINRESILCGGLKPQVGTSYFCHWNCKKGLKPLVFLYDKEIIEYDTTYDDDIYQIDTLQLDKRGFELDPDEGMIGCFTYDVEIPCSFCKIIYKGTGEEL